MTYVGFDKLKSELAGRKGVTDPGGLAAYIGRKKDGAAAFNAAARNGRKLKPRSRKHRVLHHLQSK